MKFYTDSYKIQQTLEGHPTVKLSCSESGRWICAQWRESIGKKGYEHHLVDNFGATYVCKVNKINSVLTIEPGTCMRVVNNLNDSEIILDYKPIYIHQLPDHVIDVLQTITLDSSIETLRRVAGEFAKRTDEIHRY